jgi:hypothetical protein
MALRHGRWEPTGTGVSHRDASGNWTHFGPADAVGLDVVRAIAIEVDGTAWFATGAGLLIHPPGGGWSTVDTGSEAIDFRTVTIDPLGRVWAGSAVGAHRRGTDGSWFTWTEASGLSDHTVNDFAFARSRTWVATHEGGITVMPRLDR